MPRPKRHDWPGARHFGMSAARVSQIVKAVQQRDEKPDLQALVGAVLGEAGQNA